MASKERKKELRYPPPPFLCIPIPCPNIKFSPCVKAGESRRVGWGGGLGSPLAGFSPNTEISFLMISPNLLDICPVFLLVFSLLGTADFLILFLPSGDGYSLLCSQKSSFFGTVQVIYNKEKPSLAMFNQHLMNNP
jgi:hypothetical protein